MLGLGQSLRLFFLNYILICRLFCVPCSSPELSHGSCRFYLLTRSPFLFGWISLFLYPMSHSLFTYNRLALGHGCSPQGREWASQQKELSPLTAHRSQRSTSRLAELLVHHVCRLCRSQAVSESLESGSSRWLLKVKRELYLLKWA